jgi:hypothetical protein
VEKKFIPRGRDFLHRGKTGLFFPRNGKTLRDFSTQWNNFEVIFPHCGKIISTLWKRRCPRSEPPQGGGGVQEKTARPKLPWQAGEGQWLRAGRGIGRIGRMRQDRRMDVFLEP